MLVFLLSYEVFQEVFSISLSSDPAVLDAEFHDVDSDGDLDLVLFVREEVSGATSSLKIYLSSSPGVLSSTPITVFENQDVYDWSIYDIDGDDYLDFVVTQLWAPGEHRLTFYKNNSLSSFTNVTGAVPSGEWSSLVNICDLNSDGSEEIYAVKDSNLSADVRETFVLYVNATDKNSISISSFEVLSSVHDALSKDPFHEPDLVKMVSLPGIENSKFFMAASVFYGGEYVNVIYGDKNTLGEFVISEKNFTFDSLYDSVSDPNAVMAKRWSIVRPFNFSYRENILGVDAVNRGFVLTFPPIWDNTTSRVRILEKLYYIEDGSVDTAGLSGVDSKLYEISSECGSCNFTVPVNFFPYDYLGLWRGEFYYAVDKYFTLDGHKGSASYLLQKDAASMTESGVSVRAVADFDGDGAEEILVYEPNSKKISLLKYTKSYTQSQEDAGVVILGNVGYLNLYAKSDLLIKFYDPFSGIMIAKKEVAKGNYASFSKAQFNYVDPESWVSYSPVDVNSFSYVRVKVINKETGKSMWLMWVVE